MNCTIKNCGQDTGTHVLCKFHALGFRHMSAGIQREIWHWFHTCVRARAPEQDGWLQCFHCEHWFPPEQICGDHWPETKVTLGAWDRFDIEKAVPSCGVCNTNPSLRKKQAEEV